MNAGTYDCAGKAGNADRPVGFSTDKAKPTLGVPGNDSEPTPTIKRKFIRCNKKAPWINIEKTRIFMFFSEPRQKFTILK